MDCAREEFVYIATEAFKDSQQSFWGSLQSIWDRPRIVGSSWEEFEVALIEFKAAPEKIEAAWFI